MIKSRVNTDYEYLLTMYICLYDLLMSAMEKPFEDIQPQ